MRGDPTVFCLIFQNKLRGQIVASAYLLYGFQKHWSLAGLNFRCSCSGPDQTKKLTKDTRDRNAAWSPCINIRFELTWVCIDILFVSMTKDKIFWSLSFAGPLTALTVSTAVGTMRLSQVTGGKDRKKNSLCNKRTHAHHACSPWIILSTYFL